MPVAVEGPVPVAAGWSVPEPCPPLPVLCGALCHQRALPLWARPLSSRCLHLLVSTLGVTVPASRSPGPARRGCVLFPWDPGRSHLPPAPFCSGDQIVGATIYFDNLQSGEVTQLLNTMGHHTVGLKLHRKGDRSPEPGQTWTHEVFSSHSSEVVLVSGPPMAGPSPSLCPLDLDSPSPSCSPPPLSVEPVWFLLFCVAADAAPTSFLSLSFGGAPAWGPTPAVWSQMPEGESAALQGSLT